MAIHYRPEVAECIVYPSIVLLPSEPIIFSSFIFRMNRLIIGKQILPFSCSHLNARFLSKVQRLQPISRTKSYEKPIDTATSEIIKNDPYFSKAEIDHLIKHPGQREDWRVIYCLRAMPLAQAFSKLKLLLTFSLVVGTPVSVAFHFAGQVSSDLCWFVFGASLFSLSTLSIFSYYSTKVVGVVSYTPHSTYVLKVTLMIQVFFSFEDKPTQTHRSTTNRLVEFLGKSV